MGKKIKKVKKAAKLSKNLAKKAIGKAKQIVGSRVHVAEIKKVLSATKNELVREVKKAGIISKSEAAQIRAEVGKLKNMILVLGKKVAVRTGKAGVRIVKKNMNPKPAKKKAAKKLRIKAKKAFKKRKK